jgi:hypothetical protein
VEARAEDKVALQQGLGAGEDVEYFLLNGVHA